MSERPDKEQMISGIPEIRAAAENAWISICEDPTLNLAVISSDDVAVIVAKGRRSYELRALIETLDLRKGESSVHVFEGDRLERKRGSDN